MSGCSFEVTSASSAYEHPLGPRFVHNCDYISENSCDEGRQMVAVASEPQRKTVTRKHEGGGGNCKYRVV